MSKALVFTAFNRPQYLRPVLESWRAVRGLEDWRVVVRIEPSEHRDEVRELFVSLLEPFHPNWEIIDNDRVYGVLEHPYVAFDELFREHDFVVRAEDDLIVSDDILEYFDWAEQEYRDDPNVVSVHGYSELHGEDEAVFLAPNFDPWIWGTWRHHWIESIAPTWDHDYTTYNFYPGHQSGWDWNLNTRIYPKHGFLGVYPMNSRVQSIGIWGVHGTPENHRESSSFKSEYGTLNYRAFAQD